MDFEIIFQDSSLLIVNKPAGLSVLAEGWDKDAPYLVRLLNERFGKVWTVHRIDKTTSGLAVFALNESAHRSMSMQFEKHQVLKKYHAILNGAPSWDQKTAKHPLRANVGGKHRTIVDDRNGVVSETGFLILERWQDSALAEAMPKTGRTHQIRVHAYALGYPLMGDVLYSAPKTDLIARPALHAQAIEFVHPALNEKMNFKAEYPDDFLNALNHLRV